MSPDTILQRVDGKAARQIDGALLMQDAETGVFWGLEGVARRIWELLETPRTLSELCTALREEYDVEDATCRADVTEFVRDLEREGMVAVNVA